MRIVTDGKKYAVKKGWIDTRFLSLKSDDDYWWSYPTYVEKYCWGTLEEAQSAMERAKSKECVRKHWRWKE